MPAFSTEKSLSRQYDFAISLQPTEGCTPWPFFSVRGIPVFATPLRGKSKVYPTNRADEYICARAHGPGTKLERTCNMIGCVNPAHMRWGAASR